ncbi:putative CENPB DNA-binding domain-containing protein 1 [Discoglossus pictus]
MSKVKEDQAKLKQQSIPLEVKMQVLDLLEHLVDIGADLKLATSTIRTILKKKDKIKSSATISTASSTKKITGSRCCALDEMEKRLSIWIDNEVDRKMPLSKAIIMEKARSIYAHIKAQTAEETESFAANRGWFYYFRKRNKPCNIKITEEATNADTEAT